MDKKTKLILIVSLVLFVFVIITTYYKIFVKHDYLVDIEVPCDSSLEYCFVGECDSLSDDTCIDNSYNYKIIEKKAYSAMICADEDWDCLICKENENNCKIINCNSKNGDICTNSI